jgi:predicted AAA+ superfamily ATPase
MDRDLYKTLQSWKNDPHRKPLIIRGARQVGKSWLVEHFGRSEFERLIVINFELQPKYVSCFTSLDPQEIVANIELNANVVVTPGATLLFLDEIQGCPQALRSLRYFHEKMPALHVIAAGSLIEFSLDAEKISMPVGRVSNYYLYPLTFGEFLSACGEDRLRAHLQNLSISNTNTEAVHEKCRDLLRTYFYLGGMPEAVASWIDNGSLRMNDEILQNLLQNYRHDFGKYGKRINVALLEKVYTRAPAQVGTRFKYVAVDEHAASRDIRSALDMLTKARIIHRIHAVPGCGLPLEASIKERTFKILFLDVGLLQNAMGIGKDTRLSNNLLSVYKGAVAEQYVGQQLISMHEPYREPQLYFWQRDARGSEAEVDYLWQQGELVLPIEVKSGKTGTLRSMRIFLKEYGVSPGIRFSMQPLSFVDSVLNIPLYAAEAVPNLVEQVLRK